MFLGKSYEVLAGKDATVALAEFKVPADKNSVPKIRPLSSEEEERLEGWVVKFKTKYHDVGAFEIE